MCDKNIFLRFFDIRDKNAVNWVNWGEKRAFQQGLWTEYSLTPSLSLEPQKWRKKSPQGPCQLGTTCASLAFGTHQVQHCMSFVFVCWHIQQINISNTNQLSWAINHSPGALLHVSSIPTTLSFLQSLWWSSSLKTGHTGCFFTDTPPKSSKYRQVNLG